jgi:hypothetical protein
VHAQRVTLSLTLPRAAEAKAQAEAEAAEEDAAAEAQVVVEAEAAEAEARRLDLSARRLVLPVYGRGGVNGAGGANPNPNAVGWLGQAGASANTWVRHGWRALRNAAKGRFGAGSLGTVRLLTGERARAASTAAASAAEQQIELGQEDVRCEIGVRAAGVEPAALGHVHAQRDVEEQQRDGDGGATSSRNGSSVSSAGESRTAQLGISSSGGWTSR